ncbi:MAG TPA: UbiA family prenyltransferase [Saprospiraceae bacterium]|nr:UbiA family prenyltransferase [Saprospiraceae bacterium]HMQ84875.1 UbiA family prenyltransferase [Saprospiraceae bacterium]
MSTGITSNIFRFFQPFINLVLYSNLWIALGALCLTGQTLFLLEGTVDAQPLLPFVFSATLFLYAAHRLIGLFTFRFKVNNSRIQVIKAFKHHILIYALFSGLAAFVSFLFLKRETQWAVLIPALVSLAYIMPIFGDGKRLRDFSFIKIFLIAIAWPWITVVLPALEVGEENYLVLGLMFAERSLFIFAITLPFDIRDIATDQFNAVKTIPQQIGIHATKHMAFLLLVGAAIFVAINCYLGTYSAANGIALYLSYLLTARLIHQADDKKNDYYYSGLMDGTILLQSLFLAVGERVVGWF